jgi:hypothetical protein
VAHVCASHLKHFTVAFTQLFKYHLIFPEAEIRRGKMIDVLPFSAVLEVIRFIGSPLDFIIILSVCRSWKKALDASDSEIWSWMAAEYKVSVHSLSQKRSSRSTSNHRNVFMKAFMKARQERKEKHEILLLKARSMFLEASRDCPVKLSSLVQSIFPRLEGFDVNWTSSVVEANTLATMCCRGNARPKCLKLLLETYSANVELGDMGGFNPLILSAFQGNLACVIYCVKRGANLLAMGRERSGLYLIAEQWASIRGHKAVAQYLREARRNFQNSSFVNCRDSSCEEKVMPSNDETFSSTHHRMNNRTSPSETIPSTPQSGPVSTSPKRNSVEGRTQEVASHSTTASLQDDSNFQELLSPIDNVKIDNNPEYYCVCSRGNIGNMVMCGGQECPYLWFHYSCVGITEDITDSEIWLCPFCDETDGYFPEPRLTVYSAFLNSPLPSLTFNSTAVLMKRRSEERARDRRKGDRTPTPRKAVRRSSPLPVRTSIAYIIPSPVGMASST